MQFIDDGNSNSNEPKQQKTINENTLYANIDEKKLHAKIDNVVLNS